MLYTSTRDNSIRVESSVAIAHGISEEGGLFVPVEIPKISMDDISRLVNYS
ncbi:MAG: threonine synthase, partial [Clostridia bacterium]|nr:threonine synthase [Clostridia bacterium]